MNPSPIHRFYLIVLLLSSILLIIPLSAADLADASVSGKSWRVLPIRSQDGFNLGLTGGEAGQHFHGIARIAANEPETAFDLNGNGRPDFNDIVLPIKER